jgi:hypothetical protein
MNTSQFYPSPIAYSLLQTPFAAVFDAPDGSSTDPNWQQVISDLVNDGIEPIFNDISDEVCAKAWMFLVPQLGFLPNMLSVKITLSAGISSKEDLSTVFSTNKNWVDQASFRAALGEFLGIHNTQLLPLTSVIGRQENTKKLIQIFSNPETAMAYVESFT